MNLFSVAVIIGDEVWNISNEPKMPRAANSSVGIFFKLDYCNSLSTAGLPMGKYNTY